MSEHTEVLENEPHGDAHAHHFTPTAHYLAVFAFLIVMLFATVGAAFVDLEKVLPVHIKGANILLMLVIAVAKATAVVLVFMEVRRGTKLVWLWAGIGFFWLLMMLGIFGDYWFRDYGASGW